MTPLSRPPEADVLRLSWLQVEPQLWLWLNPFPPASSVIPRFAAAQGDTERMLIVCGVRDLVTEG